MRKAIARGIMPACLATLLAGGASMARDALPPTPAQLFGALFAGVQTESVYPDSKTFADATPRSAPSIIMERFRSASLRTRADWSAFVEKNFDAPAAASTHPVVGGTMLAHIAALWPLLTRPAATPPPYSSLLFVPHAYIVPGGRFREFYYWDTYFTMLGLIRDGHMDIARGLVANFAYLIDRFGHVPNGTRTYYLSRSQPPFFYLMVELIRTPGDDALVRYLPQLRREHDFWMHGARGLKAGESRENVVALPDGALLNRYWDARATPREESFREDVALAARSGRPSQEIYRDIRAAAESGWDFSSRWLADGQTLASIHTTAIVPVDLNALIYGMERSIAGACTRTRDMACASEYSAIANRRAQAIQHYLWAASEGRFADFDWPNRRSTAVISAATLYPLFVGLATAPQAEAVAAAIRTHLLKSGGLAATPTHTGQQWDAPNGWPPLQWIAVEGLERNGQAELAREIAQRWLATVQRVYAQTGKLLEKYDVEEVLPGGGGEYPLQDGFGWTNGVTRALLERYSAARSPSALRNPSTNALEYHGVQPSRTPRNEQ